MATYSREDRLAAIKKAGFADPLKALAVSLAEFGENRDINTQSQSDVYANGVREESYGPWQIHLPAHPDVSRSCAMDLECSTQVAAKMSKGGTDFGPWSAFTNGSFQRFLDELNQSSSPSHDDAGGGGNTSTTPAAGASPEGYSCGLDAASIVVIGQRLKAGQKPQEIADALTQSLGRQITVECMRFDAYRAAGDVGKLIDAATSIPVLGGAAQVAAGGIKTWQDAAKPENLWRAGFLVLGAALIFFGARLYFHADTASEQPMPAEGGAT